MGGPQLAPLLTLLKPSTVAAYTAAGFWGDQTIYQLAVRQARAMPQASALRDRDRRLSYPELVDAADRLAAHLAGHGIRPGNRVAVWLPSRVETAIALLACSRNGYICCPSLHRNHRVREVVALAERMRCSALIAQPAYGADADRCDVFSELAGRDFLRCAWRIGSADAVPFGELPGPVLEAERSGDANQVMYLPFTSGTTGEPKGVMHSDNTLLATARAMARDWRLERAVLYTLSSAQSQSRTRCADYSARRRRRTGLARSAARCEPARSARRDRRRVPVRRTHPRDRPAHRAASSQCPGCRGGARLSGLGRSRASASRRRADSVRHPAAERLRHDGNLLASIHAAR